jgi:phage terminase small subunit
MSKEKSLKELFDLTDKQERFVAEYLVDFNGTQAAVRAGYSERSAREIAHKLLTKDHIQSALSQEKKKIKDKIDITKQDLIKRTLSLIDPNLIDISEKIEKGEELSKSEKNSLTMLEKNITIDRENNSRSIEINKFKITDKLKGIELIGRMIGAFDDKLLIDPAEAWQVLFLDTKRRAEADPKLKEQIEGKKDDFRD